MNLVATVSVVLGATCYITIKHICKSGDFFELLALTNARGIVEQKALAHWFYSSGIESDQLKAMVAIRTFFLHFHEVFMLRSKNSHANLWVLQTSLYRLSHTEQKVLL